MDHRAIAAAFAGSGALHLVRPRTFEGMIPPQLPNPTAIVYASGVAELVLAAGLVGGRRWAGPAGAAFLVGVLPAHVQMVVDATAAARRKPTAKRLAYAAVAWARLPLQVPLIRAALR
ncbi:MAG TPA: hypothetical protein VLM05_18360 [Mycobacteriales bacterium]|nr:hypothetical protein [Mycobacteriales bacterium]